MTAPALAVAGRPAFFHALFSALDSQQVRYCVLHSYEDLTSRTQGDVDLAVHPADMNGLLATFAGLLRSGYTLVQGLNYAVGACYFVFAWVEEQAIRTVEIDVMCEHRRSGLVLATSDALVSRRRRLGEMWVAAPEDEFEYLLAKKSLKGSVPRRQQERLRGLGRELGWPTARRIAALLFGEGRADEIVRGCNADCTSLLPSRRRSLWWNAFRRRPWRCCQAWVAEGARACRRWFRPTGLWVAVLGPDGAGKSTLIESLLPQAGGAFRRRYQFHWRPRALWRSGGKATSNPHQQAPRGPVASVAACVLLLLDYWVGYWLLIRPRLARSGWVIFDRYSDDLIADPRRYRYGGPMWVARLLRRLTPRPDMVLVLDAPEETVASRKQELEPDEVQRQREAYRRLADGDRRFVIIDAAAPARSVCAQAGGAVIGLLAERFRGRFGFALMPSENAVSTVVERSFGEPCFTLAGGTDPLVWLGMRRSRAEANPGPQGFTPLPTLEAARWLLPSGGRGVAAGSFRRIYAPYAWKSRLGKATLLLGIGTPGRHRWQTAVVLPRHSVSRFETLVRECTGTRHPIFSVSMGTSTAYRKAILQVMRESGEVVGYLKFPLTDAAGERVRREAAVLSRLAAWDELRPSLPEVLYDGDADGLPVLFTAPLAGRPGPVRLTPAHDRFLYALRNRSRCLLPAADLISAIARRWSAVSMRIRPESWELGAAVLDRIRGERAPREIECCLGHGDFAPWNTRVDGDRFRAFDWESADWQQPVAWDRWHFEVQVGTLLHRPRRLAKLAETALEEEASGRGLLLLYLLNSTCSLLEEGHPQEDIGIRGRLRLLSQLAEEAAPVTCA